MPTPADIPRHGDGHQPANVASTPAACDLFALISRNMHVAAVPRGGKAFHHLEAATQLAAPRLERTPL